MEFIIIYTPKKLEAQAFLAKHKPLTDSYIGGNFNTHNQMWYGSLAPDILAVIKSSTKSTNFIVEWSTLYAMTLLNTTGTATHFPHNRQRPTIPELHMPKLVQRPRRGSDSNYPLITMLMSIASPSFSPCRQFNSTEPSGIYFATHEQTGHLHSQLQYQGWHPTSFLHN